ncbi:MAG TPA: aspartate aminotransferase family protein [Dehalococcoidia bacterium]|nr:aspartate aminotransferase family protein [Dehalococcoidia bacterium]
MTEAITDAYTRLHPASAALYQESLQTFPSGVTHDIRFLQPFPIFVDRAGGSRKWDVDGNEYIDYVMGHGALFMGHTHPEITAAVVEQAQKGTHYGANHRLELEWGALVRQIVPSAEEVRFTSSGTEATLMAIRLARAYTGRDKLLKFDQHFHGWHDAVVGARAPEEDNPHSAGVPSGTAGNTVSVPQNEIALVEEKLSGGDVAAIILEPTGASYGTLPLRDGFLAELRKLASRHDAVLIFDEVVTGFRVAPGGAQQRYGVAPDLTTMAKILAGGLPGGAVAGKTDIISMLEIRSDAAWNAERRVQHPGTFNANPLSAAAGVAMLRMVAPGEHHQHADALNARLIPALNGVLDSVGVAGAVYGLASYFHIVLGEDMPRPRAGIEWQPADGQLPSRMSIPLAMSLKRAMLNHGIDLMSGAGGFTSGVHTDEDIDRTVEAFESAVQEMQAEGML